VLPEAGAGLLPEQNDEAAPSNRRQCEMSSGWRIAPPAWRGLSNAIGAIAACAGRAPDRRQIAQAPNATA